MISNLKDLWHKLTAPRATDEDEAGRESIANVIAERERLLAAERAQARRQAALFRLSAELAATLDEAEVCRRVVDGLHDTLGYDVVALYLMDQTTGDRVHAASVGFVEPPPRIPPGQGLSERPLLDGQLHYTPDVTRDPRYFYGMGGSEVDVPVRIGGKVLGVLIAERKERDAFDRDDFEVLTAAAQQTGLAIEKARLLAAERQRADELDALRTTMADITAELELSALLQVIVERAAGLLDATGGELGLYDEASQEVRIVVSHNLGKEYVGTRHALGEGAMGRVAQSGEPLIIEDYHAWEGRAPQYADVHIRASLAVPLEVGGWLVGVITIATANPARQFGPADLHLLNLFAQQAAIAIENARLYDQAQREIAERKRAEEEAQRRAAQAALIYEVGRRVSGELELEALLSEIVTVVRDAFDYYSVALGLLDEEAEYLAVWADAGAYADMFPEDHRIAIGEGMTGYAAATGETRISGDVSKDPHYIRAAKEETKSELVVPIKSGQKVIGVLDLQSKEFDAFDETDVMLMETLADQVAVAIENAWLFEQAQEEIAERKRAEAELRKYQEHLEELVEERTAELRESEERYRTLFDGVPVGLYRTTPAGQTMDANLAMVQMLGYLDRETLLATNTADLYANPQDRVQWQALMEREGVVRDFEIRHRRYDGTVIWVNDTARAVRDEQGQVVHYEGSLEDITERKQAEAELRKYQEHLEELVEERTAELRESEERYRTLFEGVPVGLFRSTPAGQIVDANLAYVQMFGYPSREDLPATLDAASHYVDPEERVRWKALMEREGVVRDFEVRNRRYDGAAIWVSQNARAVKDEQGQVLYYEGSLEDITERKKFEEEIRRQKDYFEALFVNSPVAVVTADLDGNVVSWNPMAEKLFVYTQEEAIGKELDDLVANDDSIRAEAAGYTDQVINLGRVQVTTKRTRKDGSLVDVELLALPLILAGEKVGFIAIYHDITERKKFEEEIRRQKEYFEALFMNSPVAALTADLDANVVSWNPMAEKLFGYTQEEAIGQNVDDLVANDPRVREEALRYTNQVLTMGRIQATAKRTRKDGSFVDVEARALPVIVAGELVGYVAIYHDIGELQKARREAEAANQAKSVFLANMSHELRTPLNAILGFTQLMDRDPGLTAEQQENLGIINRSGEHLLVLINDVLEMSKIEAGRVTLQETSFDVYRLLDGLEEMFGLRAKDKGLALSFERAENVPQYVRTDEGKLRQVLSNLLGNAVKFTQEGGVTLRVTAPSLALPRERGRETASPLQAEGTEGGRLLFEVEDTGPGIAPEDLAAVFDPFVQATSGQEPQEGTGLGLSISRQYVRLMGGDLTVSSELGQGSLFQFDVQVGLAEAAEVQAAQPRRRVLGLEPNQPLYRLLVAEDKETNRQLLVKLLEPLGFEVQEVVNGREAIEIWERWEPHLIWMDMRMPVMDGYEATRRIKATTKGQATVIIALTASAFEGDRERMLSEGCDDFVRKPFREDEIYDMLTKHLGVRFVYDEEPAQPAAAQPADDVLTPAARAALPANWVADLQQATIRADLNLILTLIDQIHRQNPALADALADLAHNFEYKRILTLIEQSGGQG